MLHALFFRPINAMVLPAPPGLSGEEWWLTWRERILQCSCPLYSIII